MPGDVTRTERLKTGADQSSKINASSARRVLRAPEVFRLTDQGFRRDVLLPPSSSKRACARLLRRPGQNLQDVGCLRIGARVGIEPDQLSVFEQVSLPASVGVLEQRYTKSGDHFLIRILQQFERKMIFVGKFLLTIDRIHADPEYLHSLFLKLGVGVEPTTPLRRPPSS